MRILQWGAISLFAFVLCGCVSLRQTSQKYFSPPQKYAGLQNARKIRDDAEDKSAFRKLVYGDLSPVRVVKCSWLRGQLYVAVLSGGLSEQDKTLVVDAARALEAAYQDNDENFLSVCDEVMASRIGRLFVNGQPFFADRSSR